MSKHEEYRRLAEEAMAKATGHAAGGLYNEANELRHIAETYMEWAKAEDFEWVFSEENKGDE